MNMAGRIKKGVWQCEAITCGLIIAFGYIPETIDTDGSYRHEEFEILTVKNVKTGASVELTDSEVIEILKTHRNNEEERLKGGEEVYYE